MPRSHHKPPPPLVGLAWSLKAEADRQLLRELGATVGTPVLFVKGAWAEPVLYGNRGLRTGCDLDILVNPSKFEAFAEALKALGYRRWEFPTHPVTWARSREWAFSGGPSHIDVDLHRSLVVSPWHRLAPEELLQRAQPYAVPGGESILSLAPEDQLLFGAAHYANHCYELSGKHLEDLLRLCALLPIDWALVRARAQAAGLAVPLGLLEASLAQHNARGLMPQATAGLADVLRRRTLAVMVTPTAEGFARKRHLPAPWDALLVNTLSSSRTRALPSFLVHYAWLRALDKLTRLRQRQGTP